MAISSSYICKYNKVIHVNLIVFTFVICKITDHERTNS